MNSTAPIRGRSDIYLSLTPSTPTPSNNFARASNLNPVSTIRFSPLTTPKYSPFRSAGLKPPTPYGGAVQFSPRTRNKERFDFVNYVWFRLRRFGTARTLLLLLLLATSLWWCTSASQNHLHVVRLGAGKFGQEQQLLEVEATKDLQFFPAVNPRIHYIGRWTSTPNRLRKDGTFSGIYFDVNIINTTSFLLSLRNARLPEAAASSSTLSVSTTPTPTIPSLKHYSFRHSPILDHPAPPISLLARVNQEEYVLLPNSSSLVSVRSNDLDINAQHQIRIIVPMTDGLDGGVIQLEGIWLSKSGKLLRPEGSLFDQNLEDEDAMKAESETMGEKHRAGLNAIMKDGRRKSAEEQENDGESDQTTIGERKKILEIITDNPGSAGGSNRGKRRGSVDGLLSGVMGWEYLIGEMFGVDHAAISIDGMCLIQDCIGKGLSPPGMGDVFFRSGPPQSTYFERPWIFQSYVPDVLVINLGSSDKASFTAHQTSYNKTTWELSETFQDTYISLIKAIRQLAYPKHPAIVHSEHAGYPNNRPPTNTPASIPIFIMRPFRGQLEHATQGVVNRLRADGDKSVFWLDTSGWLSESESSSSSDVEDTTGQDFVLDEAATPAKWHLTKQGNQRAAIFLHMHVCRYLARVEEECAFLPPDVYQGRVFDPEEASFDRFLESGKERELKEMFWEGGGGDDREEG